MEQKLFFKSYSDEDSEARLARIEKRIFGDAVPGDFNQRLERVKAAVAPQVNPDGTTTGAPEPVATAAPPPPPVRQSDPQSEMERARIAVMAAKEEEVAKLLADGVELWRQKRGPQAIERFEQVLRLDQHNSEAHFNLGVVYESANNLVEASASYHRAAEENPNNKDYRDAVAAVEKKLSARKKTDDKAGELRVLAEDAAAAYKRQEYFSALDLYKQLDAKAPNKALVKYNIGTLYFVTKNFVDALTYYKAALKLEPKEPRYQQAVQQLSANLKQGEEAQKEIDQKWQQYQQATGGVGLDGKPTKPPKKDKKASAPPQQQPQQQSYVAPAVQPPQNIDFMAGIGIIAKPAHEGLQIVQVGIASRAAHVGLQQGDLIKAVDGNIVKSMSDANQILSRKQQGAPVMLMIQRANQMGQFNL
ncbi:MAG: tetratricopeptide repeat protein [Candidatus Melainabacteria bacterium]|nr:tetratricopeptide repeat protein [Candidatus Melainabacteria bacterium]